MKTQTNAKHKHTQFQKKWGQIHWSDKNRVFQSMFLSCSSKIKIKERKEIASPTGETVLWFLVLRRPSTPNGTAGAFDTRGALHADPYYSTIHEFCDNATPPLMRPLKAVYWLFKGPWFKVWEVISCQRLFAIEHCILILVFNPPSRVTSVFQNVTFHP